MFAQQIEEEDMGKASAAEDVGARGPAEKLTRMAWCNIDFSKDIVVTSANHNMMYKITL